MQAEQSSTSIIDRRRTGRLGLLALLLILLTGAVALLTYYLATEQPLTLLPRVVSRDTPPRYLFSISRVGFPTQLAVSRDGRLLYSVEKANNSVFAFDRQGRLEYTLIPPETEMAERFPVAVATTPDGQVLVTDGKRYVVDVYSAEGDYLGEIRSPDGSAWTPTGVAVDGDGNTYVTDGTQEGRRVVVFDQRYHKRAEYTRPVTGRLVVSLGSAAVDASGRLYVSNVTAGTVDMFGPDGEFLSPAEVGNFGGGMPGGVWIDTQNRLYAVDSVNATVSVYDLNMAPGKLLFKFGNDGAAAARLSYPMGVAGDITGRVYIADPGARRVHVWQY